MVAQYFYPGVMSVQIASVPGKHSDANYVKYCGCAELSDIDLRL